MNRHYLTLFSIFCFYYDLALAGPLEHRFDPGHTGSVGSVYHLRTAVKNMDAGQSRPCTIDPNIKKAIEIVANLESKVDSLYHFTGFLNKEGFLKAIEETPSTVLLLESLDQNLFFAMQVPEEYRDLIAVSGFKNLHQTGKSRGVQSKSLRNISEAIQSGIPTKEYLLMDPTIKPKYGFLLPSDESGYIKPNLSDYGADTYIFKKNRLKNRTTFTSGDSLYKDAFSAETRPVLDWIDFLTPWSRREFMLAEIGRRPYLRTTKTPPDPPGTAGILHHMTVSADYNELQFWGPLSLDDVEALEFTGTPPSEDFVEVLQSKSIEIRDLRRKSIGKF